jgi:hypothetical protein
MLVIDGNYRFEALGNGEAIAFHASDPNRAELERRVAGAELDALLAHSDAVAFVVDEALGDKLAEISPAGGQEPKPLHPAA